MQERDPAVADREFKDLFKHPFLTGRSPTAHPAMQPHKSPGFLASNSPRMAIAPTSSQQTGREKPPVEAHPPSHGWNGMHAGAPGGPPGSAPPPPNQLAAGHRIGSGLSGQLMPAASGSSTAAAGRGSPRGGTPPSSARTEQHAESSLPAPPPNTDGSVPYSQSIPVAVADHLPKSQGVAVSGPDATGHPGAVRLQLQQTPSQSRSPATAGYQLVQYPGGQVYAYAHGPSPQHGSAPALHDGAHGMPEGEGPRYVKLDRVTYVPSPGPASGAGPQAMRSQQQGPASGTRLGGHDQQQHPQQIQVGGAVGSTTVVQQADMLPMERVGSGSHAWPVAIPVHSGALGNLPVTLQASGESLSSYAAAAAADAANERSTPSHSQREEPQGSVEGHGDSSAKARARALSGGHAPSEDSLTACTSVQRRRSNPQLQGPLPPRPSASHRRASSETHQCTTEYSGASSVTSTDDANPGRASKTTSAGTAPAAGLDGGTEGAAVFSPEQGTPVHVLSSQNFHNVQSHQHHDYQMLRPYLQQSYVELRPGGGTGAHHTTAHAGVPSSQGPQASPGAIYVTSPGEGLHGSVMRAGVPGGPVVVTTAGMAPGHHLHLPVAVPAPAVHFIPHLHGHTHAHANQPPQTQQGAGVGGGPGGSMAPQPHVLQGVPMLVQQHQQVAHGIEGAHPGMFSIVVPQQQGMYVVRIVSQCLRSIAVCSNASPSFDNDASPSPCHCFVCSDCSDKTASPACVL